MSYNILINSGESCDIQLTWKDSAGIVQDLTGCSVSLVARYTSKSGTLALDLSTSNGGLVVDTSNNILLSLSPAQTKQLNDDVIYYDIEVNDNNKIYRILEGNIVVTKGVKRDV